MNRLIIVGNGFDLAHGLPTGYGHFIDWYWKGVFKALILQNKRRMLYGDNILSFEVDFSAVEIPRALEDFKQISTYVEFEIFLENLDKIYEDHCGLYYSLNTGNFFSVINQARTKNWVDIENEYYKLLKECLKEKNNSKVKKLNIEFEVVKKLLEKYLFESVEYKYDFSESIDTTKIIDIFNLSDRLSKPNKFLLEFDDKEQENLLDWIKRFSDFGYISNGNLT